MKLIKLLHIVQNEVCVVIIFSKAVKVLRHSMLSVFLNSCQIAISNIYNIKWKIFFLTNPLNYFHGVLWHKGLGHIQKPGQSSRDKRTSFHMTRPGLVIYRRVMKGFGDHIQACQEETLWSISNVFHRHGQVYCKMLHVCFFRIFLSWKTQLFYSNSIIWKPVIVLCNNNLNLQNLTSYEKLKNHVLIINLPRNCPREENSYVVDLFHYILVGAIPTLFNLYRFLAVDLETNFFKKYRLFLTYF